eukprot:7656012-Prorocentrum_lima.AAC.1
MAAAQATNLEAVLVDTYDPTVSDHIPVSFRQVKVSLTSWVRVSCMTPEEWAEKIEEVSPALMQCGHSHVSLEIFQDTVRMLHREQRLKSSMITHVAGILSASRSALRLMHLGRAEQAAVICRRLPNFPNSIDSLSRLIASTVEKLGMDVIGAHESREDYRAQHQKHRWAQLTSRWRLRQLRSSLSQLSRDNVVITEPESVGDELYRHWSQKFGSHTSVLPESFSTMDEYIPRYSWPDLPSPTSEEIGMLLRRAPRCCPGPDCIPYEAYAIFPPIWAPLASITHDWLHGADLPCTFHETHMVCIPKSD